MWPPFITLPATYIWIIQWHVLCNHRSPWSCRPTVTITLPLVVAICGELEVFKMPGVETTGASVNSPKSVLERPLFRSGKPLPRGAEVPWDPDLAHSASSNNGGHISGAIPIATAPALPLTPPSAGHEEASSNDASGMQTTTSSHSANYIHGAMTPTKPSRPPYFT